MSAKPSKVQGELLELMAHGREMTTWASGLSYKVNGRRRVTSRTVDPMLAAGWIERSGTRDYSLTMREFVFTITAVGRAVLERGDRK